MAKPISNNQIIVDTLMHNKDKDGNDIIEMPFTRYDNVLASPAVISSLENAKGAPFAVLITDVVDIDTETFVSIFGPLFNT